MSEDKPTPELGQPFELVQIGTEDNFVSVFIVHSGLGILKLAVSQRGDNPIVAFIRSDQYGDPGTPIPPNEDGSHWLDDDAVAIEFHNQESIDQLIDFLQKLKETVYR